MNTSAKLIIGLIILCAAAAVVFYSKKNKKSTEYPKVNDEDAKYEFKILYKKFEGNYEPLFLVAKGISSLDLAGKMLDNWSHLIQRYSSGPMKEVWNELASKSFSNNVFNSSDNAGSAVMANAWLSKLREWGAERQDADEIIIDASTPKYYVITDAYEPGDRAKVIRHCWIMHDTEMVIEYGRVDPIN